MTVFHLPVTATTLPHPVVSVQRRDDREASAVLRFRLSLGSLRNRKNLSAAGVAPGLYMADAGNGFGSPIPRGFGR
jgi:hypothetical protein